MSEAYIDALLARDDEIMPMVLANDGSGSGLDADLLDGQDSSAFAAVGHNHDDVYLNDDRAEIISAAVTNGALLAVNNTGAGTDVWGLEASGEDVGVYGYSSSGVAGYFGGDVHVTGDLTWDAKTGYVSVHSSAFRPVEDGYDFYNGEYLYANNAASRYYRTSVHLPHGATVTKVTYYFRDAAANNTSLHMYSGLLTGAGLGMMATVSSSGTPGNSSGYDDSIAYATIDNSQYAYYLVVDLPGGEGTNLRAYGVLIEYTYTGPH